MAWTNALTFIPQNKWTFSPELEGEYFRFKSLNAPFDAQVVVAQAQFANGQVEFSDIQTLPAISEWQVVRFPKPKVFENRRIALIQPVKFARSSRWAVQCDVSNVVSADAGSGKTRACNFEYFGDASGLLFFLGTARGNSLWNNPIAGQGIGVVINRTNGGQLSSIADRNLSDFYLDSAPGNWIKFDLYAGNKLQPSYYVLRNRHAGGHYLRNWNLEGSNDGQNWTVLDSQINNQTFTEPSQWFGAAISTSTFYRYFRLNQTGPTGDNSYYLCLGEIELYGSFSYS